MEAASEIRDYIVTQLRQRTDVDVTDQTPLIESGVLTSLEAVDLVAFLEERYRVEIDPDEINETDFQTISSIAALVERKLAARRVLR